MTKSRGVLFLMVLVAGVAACAQPDEPVVMARPTAGAHALVSYKGLALPVSLGVWTSFTQRGVSCEHTLVAVSLGIDSVRRRYAVEHVIQATCENPQTYDVTSWGSYAQTDSLLLLNDGGTPFGGILRPGRIVLWQPEGTLEFAADATPVMDAAGAPFRLESVNGVPLPAPRNPAGTCTPTVSAGSLRFTRSGPPFTGGAAGTFAFEYTDDFPCRGSLETLRYSGTYEQLGGSIRMEASTAPDLDPGFVIPLPARVVQDHVETYVNGLMVFRR